mgnify:CR=1 FL=1
MIQLLFDKDFLLILFAGDRKSMYPMGSQPNKGKSDPKWVLINTKTQITG